MTYQSPKDHYQFHEDNTIPSETEGFIWVFGSNLKGIHGKAGAKVAHVNFGAVYGQGRGPTGMAYAIPTKLTPYRGLSFEAVAQEVRVFLAYAKANPQRKFYVTRIGCGNAGFKDAEMAPLFKGAPANCNFPEEWREYL
jgi:hypothetical protein